MLANKSINKKNRMLKINNVTMP
ncbi:UNVERIFIED_CONTAM: hypothetical protein GTU68_002230 [Idotea baltica]|nr:hypothetical protein [Idotea baltica]